MTPAMLAPLLYAGTTIDSSTLVRSSESTGDLPAIKETPAPIFAQFYASTTKASAPGGTGTYRDSGGRGSRASPPCPLA
jgi:hypothetical protein